MNDTKLLMRGSSNVCMHVCLNEWINESMIENFRNDLSKGLIY